MKRKLRHNYYLYKNIVHITAIYLMLTSIPEGTLQLPQERL